LLLFAALVITCVSLTTRTNETYSHCAVHWAEANCLE